MNLLRLSWWCTPIISFFWIQARDAAVRGKYKKCLSKLKWIRRMRGPNIRPLGQWTTEYYLSQGHCHYKLNQLDNAKESFEAALKALKKADIYTLMEQAYIRAYIISDNTDLEFSIAEPIDYEEIDLDNIEPDLRNYYPLTAHPNWDDEEEEYAGTPGS